MALRAKYLVFGGRIVLLLLLNEKCNQRKPERTASQLIWCRREQVISSQSFMCSFILTCDIYCISTVYEIKWHELKIMRLSHRKCHPGVFKNAPFMGPAWLMAAVSALHGHGRKKRGCQGCHQSSIGTVWPSPTQAKSLNNINIIFRVTGKMHILEVPNT